MRLLVGCCAFGACCAFKYYPMYKVIWKAIMKHVTLKRNHLNATFVKNVLEDHIPWSVMKMIIKKRRYLNVIHAINVSNIKVISVMGREISRPDFPAGTSREMLSRPVSSRHFEKIRSLVLSWIQFWKNFKVLSCLEMHLSVSNLSWIFVFSCLIVSSCLVSGNSVSTHLGQNIEFEDLSFLTPDP